MLDRRNHSMGPRHMKMGMAYDDLSGYTKNMNRLSAILFTAKNRSAKRSRYFAVKRIELGRFGFRHYRNVGTGPRRTKIGMAYDHLSGYTKKHESP